MNASKVLIYPFYDSTDCIHSSWSYFIFVEINLNCSWRHIYCSPCRNPTQSFHTVDYNLKLHLYTNFRQSFTLKVSKIVFSSPISLSCLPSAMSPICVRDAPENGNDYTL